MIFLWFLHHKLFTSCFKANLKWSYNCQEYTHTHTHTQPRTHTANISAMFYHSQNSNSLTVSMECGREAPRSLPPHFSSTFSHSFQPKPHSHWSRRNIRRIICLTASHNLTLEMYEELGVLEGNQAKASVSWKYVENILQHDNLKFQWLC